MAEEPKLTCLGKLVILAFIIACFGGAYYFFMMGSRNATTVVTPNSPGLNTNGQITPPRVLDGNAVTVGIAYGTEKKRWLEWAVEKFAETPQGKKIKIELIPLGSVEAANAIIAGDKRINVWSPASALYKDVFVTNWQVKNGGDPIAKAENLALTPMVFVTWQERHAAFVQKYTVLDFKTLGEALNRKNNWGDIAGKSEWGIFKFGHTHPNESNSGLMALVMMAYDFHDKTNGLELKQIVDPKFQSWMQDFERGVSGLSNSTGNMMKEMVLKGPSSYDSLLVYEQVAMDYLKNAEGRWGSLQLSYPKKNMWNEHPYYILNTAWSSSEQRKAAQVFLDYLMSAPVQTEAVTYGFRPGNADVAIKTPESPFIKYAKFGVQIDITTVCEPPKPEVIENLLLSWQRGRQ